VSLFAIQTIDYLSILDTITRRGGSNSERLSTANVVKIVFYLSFLSFILFMIASPWIFGNDRTVPEIPATRTEAEAIEQTKAYLKTVSHRGFRENDPEVNCWETFKEAKFSARYLELYGAWQVDAWYSRVRYYWRVTDSSLEVAPDGLLFTENETIAC
jgi:hypothetical protein